MKHDIRHPSGVLTHAVLSDLRYVQQITAMQLAQELTHSLNEKYRWAKDMAACVCDLDKRGQLDVHGQEVNGEILHSSEISCLLQFGRGELSASEAMGDLLEFAAHQVISIEEKKDKESLEGLYRFRRMAVAERLEKLLTDDISDAR